MIVGNGTLGHALRAIYGDVPFTWIAYDTPLCADGIPDTGWVLANMHSVLDETPDRHVVISSQLPVGTCARMESLYPHLQFIVVPENVRAKTAEDDWRKLDYIVFGSRISKVPMPLYKLVSSVPTVLMVSPETAEMTKHAVNVMLALQVQFAAELERLAVLHGADPEDLARCVMVDPRIGAKAYLKPGGDPGPHLIREVRTLAALGGGPLIDTLESTCWPS